MPDLLRATLVAALLVAVAGIGMLAALDNVALQLALRDAPKVWGEHLSMLIPTAALVGLAGAGLAYFWPTGPNGWLAVGVAFVAWQVLGSSVVAPLAVGELEPEHFGMVLPVVAGLGAYPTAAAAGTWLGARVRGRGARQTGLLVDQ
ncbi:MAG: hypothetical protein H0W07_03570 [Chloroflexi bacterium]|nr:hypothetical protein [Chloroflexota bacterium]